MIPSRLQLAVAHADVSAHMAFHSSADFFHTGALNNNWWKDVRTLPNLDTPMTLRERSFIVVEGDVVADIKLSDSSTIIVYGNVRASIQTSGQCEVVIAGDVLEGACVSGDAMLNVFVGGDQAGCLRSHGSCKAWFERHLRGVVCTGSPSTEVYVLGDCSAVIRPTERPALLFLQVAGFMAYRSLEATAVAGYTEFLASIGRSDRPPGLYPQKAVEDTMTKHRSCDRWVIWKEEKGEYSELSGATRIV
jgi:hypothetical protein